MAFIWHLTIVEMKDNLLVTGTVLKHKTSIDKQPIHFEEFLECHNILSKKPLQK